MTQPIAPIAFLDASVLYPAGTRNLLMRLASHQLFHARWSNHVHKEWMTAVHRDYPDIPAPQLDRIRDLMNAHVEDAVVFGYERIIDDVVLPDPDDRHVLAAAITSNASLIVTCNLRHFPNECLEPHGIKGLHPDAFVLRFFEVLPDRVLEALREHRRSLRNPAFSAEEYLAVLERQGLVRTVAALRSAPVEL